MNEPIKQAFDKQLADIQMTEADLARLSQAPLKAASGSRPLRKVLALAAVLVVLAGAAYSASQFLGTVDWQGNRTAEEAATSPTFSPESPAPQEEVRLERLAHEALSRKPPEELWLALTGEGRWMTYFPKIRVNSFEAARTLLANSSSPLRLPETLPPGYAFNDGVLSLYIDTRHYENLEALPEEHPEPGLTLRGFRLPKEALGDFSGYTLQLLSAKGDELRLQAQLSSAQESFGLWQGDSYKTAAIPGFAQALSFEREGVRQLYFQQTGFEPLSVCRMDYFTIARDRPDYPLEPEALSSITYTLFHRAPSGGGLSSDALMRLAEQFTKP